MLNTTRKKNFIDEMQDYIVVPNGGDGDCVPRVFSQHLYDNQGKHMQVRRHICNTMHHTRHSDYFVDFVQGNISPDEYVRRMREQGKWMGEPEIMAASLMLSRKIDLYDDSGNFPVPISFPGHAVGNDILSMFDDDEPPIRIMRTKGNHVELLIPRQSHRDFDKHKSDDEYESANEDDYSNKGEAYLSPTPSGDFSALTGYGIDESSYLSETKEDTDKVNQDPPAAPTSLERIAENMRKRMTNLFGGISPMSDKGIPVSEDEVEYNALNSNKGENESNASLSVVLLSDKESPPAKTTPTPTKISSKKKKSGRELLSDFEGVGNHDDITHLRGNSTQKKKKKVTPKKREIHSTGRKPGSRYPLRDRK